jgi:hypothetical protein
MPALSDALLVNTKGDSPLNANAPSGTDTAQASNFVTVQSFGTFAVASPVLKTIWELLRQLSGSWADSFWTALGICLVYGFWQFLVTVTGANRVKGFMNGVSAFVIAAVNAGILAAAIIGLSDATNIDQTG